MISVGSDFSGVGAFDQALERLGIKQNKKFACDMDKYARQTYIYNFGEPDYYPENVYDREIPKESLDIYMTSPPCQSFSLAGKRKGEDSKNGVLFYNSHEFIQKNKPRYFIFENVKGLLSDDGGKTFQRWIDYLGGKSVNGNPAIFPHENSVPYHIYYKVLNAKHYGIPQNRERIFIIGIRDDGDNNFNWPKPFHLVKRLKDVLENEVDEKYFLSDKMMEGLVNTEHLKADRINNALRCGGGASLSKKHSFDMVQIGAIRGRNPQNPLSRVSGLSTEQMLEINENGTSNALTTVQKDNVVVLPAEVYQLNQSKESGGKQPFQQNRVYDIDGVSTTLCRDKADILIIPTNNSKGYDIATDEDSINFSNPNSETRRGRVGKGVAQTLDTGCNQGVLVGVTINDRIAGWHENENVIGAHQGDFKRSSVSEHIYHKEGGVCTTIQTAHVPKLIQQRIRRLTPTECFRLMDFNEKFKWNVSDSQAYRQAGNSICVGVLAAIIEKLINRIE